MAMQMNTTSSDLPARDPAAWQMALYAVSSGFVWLEKRMPGSTAHVHLARLDIGDGDACVLGQLFFEDARHARVSSGYLFGCGCLGISMDEAERYGLAEFEGVSAELLTLAWRLTLSVAHWRVEM